MITGYGPVILSEQQSLMRSRSIAHVERATTMGFLAGSRGETRPLTLAGERIARPDGWSRMLGRAAL
jgi:hypothetical protein